LAALPIHRPSDARDSDPGQPAAPEGRCTEHLKRVPELRADRERIRNAAFSLACQLDRSRLLARHEMEAHARAILAALNLPEAYVGWTMVALGTAFWRDQVMSVPTSRRLLLLPHCLRDTGACPAEYDEFGLRCQDCGACRLTGLRELARQKGYRVLIAEGSPIVLKIILAGHVDAVMGVACLIRLDAAGKCDQARLVFLNAGDGPVPADEAAAGLQGNSITEGSARAASLHASEKEIEPLGNLHATPAFQRPLARVLARRAILTANERARQASAA